MRKPFAWNLATVDVGDEHHEQVRLVVTKVAGKWRASMFDHLGSVLGVLYPLDPLVSFMRRGRATLIADGVTWSAEKEGGCGC